MIIFDYNYFYKWFWLIIVNMNHLFYPTFEVIDGIGIIPKIFIPRNLEELVPKFYENGGRKCVEDYVESLYECFGEDFVIRLNWDGRMGLRNISLGATGLDLNERGLPNFQEHNLGGDGRNSFVVGAVAMKYISELIKVRD
jgi:hypothetical protein